MLDVRDLRVHKLWEHHGMATASFFHSVRKGLSCLTECWPSRIFSGLPHPRRGGYFFLFSDVPWRRLDRCYGLGHPLVYKLPD